MGLWLKTGDSSNKQFPKEGSISINQSGGLVIFFPKLSLLLVQDL